MITLIQAKKNMESRLPDTLKLISGFCGEAQGKYVFGACNRSSGMVIPGGMNWTVDKETGEYKCERLEREFLAPYAPIRGFKKLEFPE